MKPMIDSAAPLPEAFNRMREEETHHLVVERGGDIVGIVSDRDLLFKGIPLHGEVLNPMLTVGEVMTPLPRLLSEDSGIEEALELMLKHRTDALPVVRAGDLIQIVTQEDLLRVMAKLMAQEPPFVDAKDRSKVVLANPVVQNVMKLVAEMGI
jgi:CBS domain-containing protein